MALDGCAAGPDAIADAPWAISLRRVESALTQKNVSAAERAWHEAYVAALRSRSRWDGLVAVGDAYLRIGEVANGRKAAEARTRELYSDALFRARALGSLEGVLRTAQAFADLGDREAVERCLHIAELLAAREANPQSQARMSLLREWPRGRSVSGSPR
jgi:hypothetical protein